jgi:hypothetical protein
MERIKAEIEFYKRYLKLMDPFEFPLLGRGVGVRPNDRN